MQKCTCEGGGNIHCYDTSCLPNESCKLQDGDYVCTPNGNNYSTGLCMIQF